MTSEKKCPCCGAEIRNRCLVEGRNWCGKCYDAFVVDVAVRMER